LQGPPGSTIRHPLMDSKSTYFPVLLQGVTQLTEHLSRASLGIPSLAWLCLGQGL
jgi:hypothetical protein